MFLYPAGDCQMSWDEYVKSCKQAVTQRRQSDDPSALPVQLLQTFHLPGPFFDSVSPFLRDTD